MKRIILTINTVFIAAYMMQAQITADFDNGRIVDFNDMSNVEDSDGKIKSDYYSAVFFVRSGSETYSVKSGARYNSDNLYAIVQNTSNTAMGHPDYDRISGEQLPDSNWYTPDESQMKGIIKTAFPKCVFGKDPTRETNNQQDLCIYMAVDPDTEKVIDMKFCIASDKPGINAKHTLFSLPPFKLRQLEELIKGNVTVKIPDEAKYHTYLRSKYRIYFKKFEL